MPEPTDRPEQDQRKRDRAAARARMDHQHTWVDQQIRVAMEKGAFDDLPGAGKPIQDLGAHHDPDWWLKKLVERERIAVLPPSLQLRKDDAELDALLDGLFAESEVRREVEDFNARVMRARYSPQDGQPPLVTMPRDVDETVAAWHRRRADRRTARAAEVAAEPESPAPPRRWWRRRRL
ncbi:DUF1992 domain-containing protein [Nocardioides sp. cx-169]|uniref:DnaJ family domain-containing protein n=1 Tax=Nocardioides sp. cx-169 TaxID=2899080 RepID=UPI001E2C1DEA|nr:DUF1992 domain-containing protein [Nocardioides sp. cx-169]MCD4533355.1 DUF1992 domain-containing protein [Nocardioides sp. cx-169]